MQESIDVLVGSAEAKRLLGIRSDATLRRMRTAWPELATKLPGLGHWKYKLAGLRQLLENKNERPTTLGE